MWKWLVTVVVLLLLGGFAYVATQCPCERIPGLWLVGNEVGASIDDWSFANDAALCQLEVPASVPHSINLNCMSDGPNLFVSCSRCEGKYWSGVALAEGRGRIRINEFIYPVSLTRVTQTETLDHAWAVRAGKLKQLGRGRDAPRPDHWWSFQLRSPSAE